LFFPTLSGLEDPAMGIDPWFLVGSLSRGFENLNLDDFSWTTSV
jgi:hypothetical protein